MRTIQVERTSNKGLCKMLYAVHTYLHVHLCYLRGEYGVGFTRFVHSTRVYRVEYDSNTMVARIMNSDLCL